MSKGSTGLGFVLGGMFGAAVGAIAGMLLAPRSGAESRAMAADAMNDVWDNAVDSYERGSRVVNTKINDFRPQVDARTDELRAKIDLARERMDQLRDSLNDAVAATSDTVANAASDVADTVNAVAGTDKSAAEPSSGSVHVDVEDNKDAGDTSEAE